MADIATRVYNHTWKIDPIIRSVIDTDFYKLLMAQTIFRRHRDVQVTFGIHNRTRRVRLADLIDDRRIARAARTRAHPAAHAGRVHLAARQHLLRQAADVLAGVHGLARKLPLPRVPARKRGRPIRPHLPRALDRDHHVGDPGARDPQRTALARRSERHGQVRASGALCAGHDAGLGEGAMAEGVAEPEHRRFRHAAAAQLLVAGLVRAGHDGGLGPVLSGHLELPHCAEARGRGGRHQRARTADGLCGVGRQRRGTRPSALSGAHGLAGGLRGQSPRHPARHLWDGQLPQERARLGRGLDRYPRRFEGPDRGRGGVDRLVAVARPGPARKARHFLRWAGCRSDLRHPSAFSRPRAPRLRLGHFADQ